MAFTFNLNCYTVSAHTVKISGDVLLCFTLNLNIILELGNVSNLVHSLVGGQLIPLQQCNLPTGSLPEPHQEGSQPLMKPTLKPVSAQQYQGIPGRISHFPEPEFTS